MAKKKPKLRLILNAEFKIAVTSDLIDKVKSEIVKGRTYMKISIPINDDIDYGISIYIDHFKSGDMNISSYDGVMANFNVNGEVIRDLDPKYDSDLIDTLTKNESIVVKCTEVSDNDMNDYYINGKDGEFVNIGNCVLA